MLSPDVQVFTPYGATESLPVCSIGSKEVLSTTRKKTEQGEGVCVGRPVKGMTVEVIRISEEPFEEWSDALRVPRGEIGEIAVKGPVVTRSYFNRDASNKARKNCRTWLDQFLSPHGRPRLLRRGGPLVVLRPQVPSRGDG